MKYEMALKPNDILCRRMPIAFLDEDASVQMLPRVIELMAQELHWDSDQQELE